MAFDFLTKVSNSVFTKLLGVMILTGILAMLVVGGMFGTAFKNPDRAPFYKNVAQYINYIIDDLGVPPDRDRALEIAKKSAIQIEYKSRNGGWSTSDKPLVAHGRGVRTWHKNHNMRMISARGKHFVEIIRGDEKFIFRLDRRFVFDADHTKFIIGLLSFLMALLLGAYYLIRRILRPISWLSEGVDQVSKGDLDHHVPIESSDEFKHLANAFNDMTGRIKNMLHSRERLLIDVSHELRSPLTRMKVALEFLSDGKEKESIKADVDEMEKMVTGILETARERNVERKLNRIKIDLSAFMDDVVDQFQEQAPGIEIEAILKTTELYTDPEQLKTVMKNLLTNAIKYSRDDSAPITISVTAQAPYTLIKVKDDGTGIPGDEIPYVFEPFYRTDISRSKQTGGYGLGLGICRAIMQAHDGKIEIESEPGQGVTVLLYFPDAKPVETLKG